MPQIGVYGLLLAIGPIAGFILDVPFGLPRASFVFVCAPVGALAGFLVGRTLNRPNSRISTRRIALIIGSITVAVAIFAYEYLLDTARPSPFSNFLFYVLYTFIFFTIYSVAGTAGLAFLDKQSPAQRQ